MQGKGERNFHVFELLLRGMGNKLGSYHLDNISTFQYAQLSSTLAPARISLFLHSYLKNRSEEVDRQMSEFNEMEEAFPDIGFTEEEIENIHRMIAVVLLLGQLVFVEAAGDTSEVDNKTVLTN